MSVLKTFTEINASYRVNVGWFNVDQQAGELDVMTTSIILNWSQTPEY